MTPITHHPENNPPKKGGLTTRTSGDVGSADYAKGKIEDPLSKNSVLMNKPGSSIPSIFARMLFFDTAFASIDPANIKANDGKAPLYNLLVSQCLDLLELVFNKGEYLEYEVWNKHEQIKALKDSNHKALAEALEIHADTYLAGVENIYLIYQRDKNGNRVLMGGTSPYTLVYTSPNWKSDKPIRSLLDREQKFQEYVFSLQQYLKTLQLGELYENNLKGFISYVDKCLAFDPTMKTRYAQNAANATYDKIMAEYPPVEYKNNAMEIAKFQLQPGVTINVEGMPRNEVSLYLQTKQDTGMHSQFYIQSDFADKFDARTAPLVLPTQKGNQYTHLKYYDEQSWKVYICEKVPRMMNLAEKVPPMPGVDSRKLELPECEAYRHNYLSEVDFLEDKLIEVPYLMDGNAFYHVINVPQSDTNPLPKSYFLPIKAVLFKYFNVRTIVDKLLKVNVVGNNKVVVTLQIPIMDQDKRPTGFVEYTREYEVPMARVATSAGKANPISVGIAPFIRLINKREERININGVLQERTVVTDDANNRYNVLLQGDNMPDDLDLTLDFVICDNGKPVDRLKESIEARRISETEGGLLHMAKTYDVRKAFDAVRLRVMHGDNDKGIEVGAGIVIPKWPERDVNRGEEKYYYSVDFGTTNTHVAYLKVNDKDTAYSFKSNEIYDQVQYLAAVPDQCAGVNKEKVLEKRRAAFLDNIYGKTGIRTLFDQARIFYPNFLLEDKEYEFPIRTVTTKKNGAVITGESENFGDLSIGFHHSKEFSINTSKAYGYDTSIKWGLEKNGDAEAEMKARLFFREILTMIRNHWMRNDDSGFGKTDGEPKLVLTFPLAMKNVNAMMDIWKKEYETVFGKVAELGTDIERVPESLAPAYRLIAKGASTDQGILNVDIGGGTTDLQYYAKAAGQPIAFYDSVRFAGDDLWGSGYENVPGSHQKDENVFTRFAAEELSNQTFDLGGKQESTFSQIDFKGKEKINVLMRDRHNYFVNKLIDNEDMPKRVAQLHYAALIYYIANWMNINPQLKDRNFPAILNFTGFGSKYIPLIFGNHDNNAQITDYTKKLLIEFGIPAEKIPSNFQLIFEPNPKDITAEGAVLYVSDKTKVPATLRQTRHMGFDGAKQLSNPKWRELTESNELMNSTFKFFDDFVDKFQTVTSHTGALSEEEAARLKERGRSSFHEMHNLLSPGADKGGTPIGEPLFFWMLKGSLFELDRAIATV